jgi:hypothetical protein
MEAVVNKSPQLLTWMVVISLMGILLCLVGTAALMGWIPISLDGIDDNIAAAGRSEVAKPEAISVTARPRDTRAYDLVGGGARRSVAGNEIVKR